MIESVRDRATFQALARARRHRRGPITVSAVATTQRGPFVAYAVGRIVGSAPERNRVRRRLRALMREHEGDLDAGRAYLVGAGPGVEELTFAELGTELGALLRETARDGRSSP